MIIIIHSKLFSKNFDFVEVKIRFNEKKYELRAMNIELFFVPLHAFFKNTHHILLIWN